jgi:hypothetical protein
MKEFLEKLFSSDFMPHAEIAVFCLPGCSGRVDFVRVQCGT